MGVEGWRGREGGGQERVAYVGGCRGGGEGGRMMVDVIVCWGWYNSPQPSQPASKYYACKED